MGEKNPTPEEMADLLKRLQEKGSVAKSKDDLVAPSEHHKKYPVKKIELPQETNEPLSKKTSGLEFPKIETTPEENEVWKLNSGKTVGFTKIRFPQDDWDKDKKNDLIISLQQKGIIVTSRQIGLIKYKFLTYEDRA
ncbi:MAG TPA: hypothetical protein VE973_02835 [Candidatus Limnocylindria bacterium]|nr:hypothetical protein [Candidatus Limnocylindria bacterium]